MSADRLFKAQYRDRRTGEIRETRVWYAWHYDLDGKQVRRSTGCTDKAAARKVLAERERKAADPDAAAKAEATLKDAFDLLDAATRARASAKKPTRSLDTLAFQAKQARGWLLFAGLRMAKDTTPSRQLSKERKSELRKLGAAFPLARINGGFVDDFISWRRASGSVGEGTIGKDLSVLRPAMRFALRAGKWGGSLEQTIPKHELDYEPGDRWLPLDELMHLRRHMEPHRFAAVAFAYALGAEPRALQRALRSDVNDDAAQVVHVRGTKAKRRDRWVPVIFDWQRDLLAFVRRHADGENGKLFSVWNNQRRVMIEACERAEIESASLMTMRHSFAHMMKEGGVRQEDLAVAMGHSDTKMLDRVYARASTPAELLRRFEAAAAERRVALRVIEGGRKAPGRAKPA